MTALLDEVVACVGCGCTDVAPCPNQCAWDPLLAKVGVPACSNCAPDILAAMEAETVAARLGMPPRPYILLPFVGPVVAPFIGGMG